tara:strand:+ start:182 stop:553 length:372 start_codon:yes stop_codon:yes gene_type:complete
MGKRKERKEENIRLQEELETMREDEIARLKEESAQIEADQLKMNVGRQYGVLDDTGQAIFSNTGDSSLSFEEDLGYSAAQGGFSESTKTAFGDLSGATPNTSNPTSLNIGALGNLYEDNLLTT